jgi:hypothetical protein
VGKLSWYHYFTSWLFWVNFLFFQWFFVRLQQTIDVQSGKTVMWDFLRYPVPMTGWWTDYKFWPSFMHRKKHPITRNYPNVKQQADKGYH